MRKATVLCLIAPRLQTERTLTISAMQKITPFLWFDTQAEEAAKFYISVFKNGKITGTSRYTAEGPGLEGTVMTVAFELNGPGVHCSEWWTSL